MIFVFRKGLFVGTMLFRLCDGWVSEMPRIVIQNVGNQVIHEFLHILGEHQFRPGDFHPDLENIALDQVINGEIVRNERFGKDFILPKDGWFSKTYSISGWRAKDVAHDLLRRGWEPSAPLAQSEIRKSPVQNTAG